jgi:predicted phage terminase large subunit-like protein
MPLTSDSVELIEREESKQVLAELAKRELARRSYAAYLPYVHGSAWKDTKMSRFIAEELQHFVEEDTGHAYDILIVEAPPQHGKSLTVTEAFPSWYMGRHPEDRVILASYDSEFAERFSRRNKEKVKQFGENIFGVTVGLVDRAQEFELDNAKGRLISRGIMSGITGNPANLVIIDDPIKNRQEADSPTYRARLWEEWQSSLKSRLAAGGKVIVIMTPWHEDDFAARLLQNEKNARLLRLPIEAEENDPLGRKPGEPLCPELGKDAAWLADFKTSYLADPKGGARAWAALYMCSPRTEGGNLIHRDWWRYYDPREIRTFATEMVSVDAAFKDGDNNDYVSIQVWGKLGNDYYLRYCLNKHLDFPGTVAALRTVRQLFPAAKTVLIEDKANGSAIIQTLRKEMFCIPINPQGGKVARVNAIAPAIESGHVFLPNVESAPWVEAFVDQFTVFPNGAHDDIVDAASQCLNRMIFSTGIIPPKEAPVEERYVRKEESAFNDPNKLFDPYQTDEGWFS